MRVVLPRRLGAHQVRHDGEGPARHDVLGHGQVGGGVGHPGGVALVDLVHVDPAVDEVVLDDAVDEVVEGLEVKVVREERGHGRGADGHEGVGEVEPDRDLGVLLEDLEGQADPGGKDTLDVTKDSPSWSKVVSTEALKVGTLAAIKSSTQAELAPLVSRNFGSAPLLPLQAPLLDSRSR